MLSEFTDKRKRDLLIITSLSIVFSVILRNAIYNALYKSFLLDSDFEYTDPNYTEKILLYYLCYSIFQIISLAFLILPSLFSIFFYNKSCDKSGLRDYKLPFPYYFFGLGINLVGDLITYLFFTSIYGILISSGTGSFQDKSPADYTGLTISSFYFVSFFVCVALNFLFWRFYFNNNSSNNIYHLNADITIKDISKHSIIFSAECFLLLFIIPLISSVASKEQSNDSYSEMIFYDFQKNTVSCIATLACIILACLIYNYLLKEKKQMKLKGFYAFIFLAANYIGKAGGLIFLTFSSLIKGVIYSSSPYTYASISVSDIDILIQVIITIIFSTILSFCLIKKYYMQKFGITGRIFSFTPSRSAPQEESIYYFPTSAQPSDDDKQNNNYNSEV